MGIVSYKDNQKEECLEFITTESIKGLHITESVNSEFTNTVNRKHKILSEVSREVLSGLGTDVIGHDDILDLEHKFNQIKSGNKYPNDNDLIRKVEKDIIKTFREFYKQKRTINDAQTEAYKKVKDIRRKIDFDINNVIKIHIQLVPNGKNYINFERKYKHKLNFINNNDRAHVLQSYKHGFDNKCFIVFVSTDEKDLLKNPRPNDINYNTEGYVNVIHPMYAPSKRYELEKESSISPRA